MICELFKYLSLKDLLDCSRVNKRWRSIYAGFKVHTLVVPDYDDESDEIGKWIYFDRQFKEFELCPPELFSKLGDQPLLSNLKHLGLFRSSGQFALDRLQSFTKLVHLEINTYYCEGALNHPELGVLVFHHPISRSLSIDCPKLRVLVYELYGNSNLLDVKHPETIRELRTNLVGPDLALFKNVEFLVPSRFEVISKSTLLALPMLKKLHYDESPFCRFQESREFDRMKQTLRAFLDDVRALRRSSFQFRFAGFQLTEALVLDQIDFGMQVAGTENCLRKEYVYLKNYHLIEPDALRFIRSVDYGRLMINAVGEFPACFAQKFSGIESVCSGAMAVQDARHFRWFLKSLRSLRDLDLVRSELGQEFYDQLPTFAPSLAILGIKAHDPTGRLFNFKFLYELPFLFRLSLSDHLTYDESISSVCLFDRLEEAEIDFDVAFNPSRNAYVWKRKYGSLWCVVDNQYERFLLENGDLDQLIECLEEFHDEISDSHESGQTSD